MSTNILGQDPYNWPFPKRGDTMSLNVIRPSDREGFGFTRQLKLDYNLRVDDIAGAQPKLKAYQFTNKTCYGLDKGDIPGASTKGSIRPHNRTKQDFQLLNQDIKGTQPMSNKFKTTRDPSNPLEPIYRLPQTIPRSATPPKFIRDNINIDDIEGTKPMPDFVKLRKDIHIFDEIEGSKPKVRFQPKDHIEIMDVKDINKYREFKSSRTTNPLEPVYTGQDEDGKVIQYGNIPGNKSRQLHPVTINKVASQTLNTKDITGAQAGTHAELFLREKNGRKDFRVSNNVVDVPGAQVGSLRRGMESKRVSNPLQPEYKLPGATEIYANQKSSTNNIGMGRSQSQQHMVGKGTNAQKLDQFLGK